MIGPEDEDDLVQDVVDDEEGQGGIGDDDASGDTDEGVGDAGQATAGADGDHSGRADNVGSDEGTARHGTPQVSRAQRRIETLNQRAKEAEERAARFEREAQEARSSQNRGPDLAAQRAQQRQAEVEQAREKARIEGDPTLYLEVVRRHDREDMDARLGQLQFQSAEASDRAAFESLCARNAAAQSLKDEVEKRLQQERSGGLNFPRETVLKFVLGERALANGGRAKTIQKKQAAETFRREMARVPNNSSRSDVSTRGTRGGDDKSARAKRLDGLNI